LSTKYFSLRYIIPITGIFLVIIYFTMYKRLESYYRWFERTFLETFENPENSDSSSENYAKLAPWDSHLISIVVHPNANMVNQSLMNSKLRSRYGINVVAIQRVMQSLIAPNPSEIIFPGDTLVVLGTDEQLDKVRPELEVPENIATMFDSNADYRLKHFKLSPSSEFVNHSIREAGVREKYHVMIVGVERDSSRIVNPHTDFKLFANDTLWVVGEAKMLEDLVASLD
jgi:CPA2 family monovalent cation:H+ antiporter-2